MPNLKELNVEENLLTHYRDLKNLDKLQSLNLAKNKFKKIKGPLPYLPSLNHMSIAENEITDLREILKLS